MTTQIRLKNGDTLTAKLYGKTSAGDRYSVFTADGGHQYVPVDAVAEIVEDYDSRQPQLWDLPIFESCWNGDARDVERW